MSLIDEKDLAERVKRIVDVMANEAGSDLVKAAALSTAAEMYRNKSQAEGMMVAMTNALNPRGKN